MCISGGDRESMPTERGQSTVLGIVFLIGLVVASSALVMLVAGQATTEIEQQSENERVQQAFIEMSQQLETASFVQDTTHEMNFDISSERDAIRKKDTGRMIVTRGGTEKINETMGSIEYTTADGSVVSYQGGGVWRGTGSEAVLLSRPPFTFDNETVIVPVTQLEGDSDLQTGSVSMTSESRRSLLSESVTGQVTVTIRSEYYGGWAEYFEDEVVGAEVTVIDSEETVRVTIGEETRTTSLADSGLISYGSMHFSGGPTVEGNVSATESITFAYDDLDDQIDDHPNQSIETRTHDDAIAAQVDEADPGDWRSSCRQDAERSWIYHCDFEGGNTYYIDEMTPQRGDLKLDLDVEDGDITLVVNDSIDLAASNDIRVFNAASGNAAKIYTTGDISLSGGTKLCTFENSMEDYDDVTESRTACRSEGGTSSESISANALQIYGTSNTDIDLGGGARVEGVISAPTIDGNQDNSGFGGADVYGAIRAGSMDIGGGFNLVYDEELADIDQPEEITRAGSSDDRYVTVIRKRIAVKNN